MSINPLDILLNIGFLILMIVPGYVLRKCKMVFRVSLGTLSAVLLYACQPFLTIKALAFAEVNDPIALIPNMCFMALAAFVVQLAAFGITWLIFAKHPDKDKSKVYIFSSMFGNCGFIGVPIAAGISGNNPIVIVYTAIFIAIFNLLLWTLGVYIITGDKKTINLRRVFLNPPTVGLLIALPLFFWPQINFLRVVEPAGNFVKFFGDMTTPLSMIIVGIRLADVPLKELLSDKGSYAASAMKLAVIPLVLFALMYPLFGANVFGEPGGKYVLPVTFIMLTLPPAASTVAFCERFKGDSATAVKTFLLGTLLSAAIMPIVTLVLLLV